jgi:DNA (cytosine-5)-methyltransferase 1
MLRIGTDCSGIEAPIQALQQLNISFEHSFSSEIDKYCIESIKANYKPNIIYDNIIDRNVEEIPDIDLYVCGFPCQSFSIAGKRKGFEDKRGLIFWNCMDVIKQKQPNYFILENVKGLLSHDKGQTWKIILNELDQLKEYVIEWKILNTKDFGIPQNRERVYILGIKKDKFKGSILSTIEKENLKNLTEFIDNTDDSYYESKRCNRNYKKDNIFVDLNFSKSTYPNADKYCPCINTHGGLWCLPKHRYANIKEHLMLQGFSIEFKQVVSNSQLKKQIGNSMSVNVLKKILKKLI